MNLKLKIRIVVSIVLISFTSSLYSQFFETGQDPASVKWRQINTRYFRLVYDSCYETQAQRLAAIFEYTDTLSGKSISQKPEKISILVHSHSAESNGLIVWAPKRMELYPVSPQDIYPQDWFEQLGLHEWRHVAQISRIRRGFTSALNLFFGQQAQGLAITFMHPWFLEGDAVSTETALSNTGRGREPSFEMEIRAFLLDNHKPYSFKKAVMGSFRDYVPDPYKLGYLMVAYNRARYGTKLWEDVLDYDGKKTFTLFPFYFALKKSTGLSRSKLYDLTFKELDSAWTFKSREISYSDINTINKRTSNIYASYDNPCIYNDSFVIAVKSGIDDINRFVSINIHTGKEKILFTPGPSIPDNLSLGKNFLVWIGIVPDLRWRNRSYSVIRILDIIKGKSKYLAVKSKYYSPVISKNAKIIATVETDFRGNNSIVLLSAENGKVINKFCSPGNNAIQTPSWDDSTQFLVMTSVGKNGKSLLILDTKSGLWQTVLAPGFTNISRPRFFGSYIIYQSGLSGIDNLYVVNIYNHTIFQITSVQFGAFKPVLNTNGQSIIFSNYTSHGFDLASISIDSSKWIPIENVKNISIDLADKISFQEKDRFDPDKIPAKTYFSKHYSKFSHLFYFHSWMPLYSNMIVSRNIYGTIVPGYMLFSQNLNGTLIAYGGQGFYNKKVYSSIVLSYKAAFPVFQIAASNLNETKLVGEPGRYNINTYGAKFSVSSYIPFNFSKGKYTQSFVPLIALAYEKRTFINLVTNVKNSDNFRFIYSLTAKRIYDISQKDLFPKSGETVSLYFSHPQNIQTSASGNYGFVTTSIYLPGIFNHHGFKMAYSQEAQDVKELLLSSNFLPPRGFNNSEEYDTSEFSKLSVASADYAFPLLYPDIQILKFIYLKRIFADLYIENANIRLIESQYVHKKSADFTSTGIEITADYNLFYIPVLINTGIRIAYKAKYNQVVCEFILRVNLNSF